MAVENVTRICLLVNFASQKERRLLDYIFYGNADMENGHRSQPCASSGRRSEKRKIAQAPSISTVSETSNAIIDVLDCPETDRMDLVSKRRRTPENSAELMPEERTLGCPRSTGDDLRVHSFVFGVGSSTCDGVKATGSMPNIDGVKTTGSMPNLPKLFSNECRVACDMGDVWTHPYYDQPTGRNSQISTGHDWIDAVLPCTQYEGYAVQRHLGNGQFSSILLAAGTSNQSRRFVVLKFLLQAEPSTPGNIQQPWTSDNAHEVEMLRQLHHPHIVPLLDFWPMYGRQCIVLEHCPVGSIKNLLEQRPSGFLTEVTSRRYFRDMHAALEYVHLQCMVHRDITTSHFLVDASNRVKLTDFRTAMHFKAGDDLPSDRPANPAYHPPEYYTEKLYNPREVDLWALGLVLYVMLTGRLPQGPDGTNIRVYEMTCLPFPDPEVLVLSAEVLDLVHGMCSILPSSRYSLARVHASPWLQDDSKKVAIGNYYLAHEPRKLKPGSEEEKAKRELGC